MCKKYVFLVLVMVAGSTVAVAQPQDLQRQAEYLASVRSNLENTVQQASTGAMEVRASDLIYDNYYVNSVILNGYNRDVNIEDNLLDIESVMYRAQLEPIVVNEILYDQDPSSSELIRTYEWVELYNAGEAVQNLEDWVITDRDALPAATLPDVEFPPGAYLVVHFSIGTDDFDFSDGEGDYYTQDAPSVTDVFVDDMDEAALFSGMPDATTIVDFVAWKRSELPYFGGVAHDFAVAAGIWTLGAFFNAANAADNHFEKVRRVRPGTSIGRDRFSTDTDLPSDWDITGGPNAIDITPGAQNLSRLEILTSSAPAPALADWTFMVYIDGDNNLEEFAFIDLNEMELAGSDENVNIVVMFDLTPGEMDVHVSHDGGHTWDPTTTAWRGLLRPDANSERVFLHYPPSDPLVGNLGEQNMGDPNTLSTFTNWAINTFPAPKYALILWNHGAGWKGTNFDDSDEDAHYIGELASALAAIPVNLDLLGFDQCLMAMVEVAYQAAPHASVLVASEASEDADGWPYDTILNGLKANPGWAEVQLSNRIVEDFGSHYTVVAPDPLHTLSAIRLDGTLTNLANLINDLGVTLRQGLEDYDFRFVTHHDPLDNVQEHVKVDRVSTELFDDENYIDVFHFASLIDADAAIPPEYKPAAPTIVAAQANVVISEVHGAGHPNAQGLSVYFPTDQASPFLLSFNAPYEHPSGGHPELARVVNYASNESKYAPNPDCTPRPNPAEQPIPTTPNFLFPQDTQWDEFLHRYYAPVADAGPDVRACVGEEVEFLGIGSSDSDGLVTKWYWDFDAAVNSDDSDRDKDCNDEANDDADAEGVSVTHTFTEPGTYVVTLTVQDDHETLHAGHFETDQDDLVVTVSEITCELVARSSDHIDVRFESVVGLKRISILQQRNIDECTVIESSTGEHVGDALEVLFAGDGGAPAHAVVRCTKEDPAKSAFVLLEAEDTVGCVVQCDPLLETLTPDATPAFALGASYPNPFTTSATIRFDVAESVPVKLVVIDLLGREVAVLVDEMMEEGRYSVSWDAVSGDGLSLAAGVYLVRMEAGDFSAVQRITVLR